MKDANSDSRNAKRNEGEEQEVIRELENCKYFYVILAYNFSLLEINRPYSTIYEVQVPLFFKVF